MAFNIPADRRYAIVLSEKSAKDGDSYVKIPEGIILKILDMNEYGVSTVISLDPKLWGKGTACRYQLLNIDDILFISPELYMFANAINDLKERRKFCVSGQSTKFILQLKRGDPVCVPPESFCEFGLLRDGVVAHIGHMIEAGRGALFVISLLVIFFTYVITNIKKKCLMSSSYRISILIFMLSSCSLK